MIKYLVRIRCKYVSGYPHYSRFTFIEENDDNMCLQCVTCWLSLIRKMTGGWDKKLVGAPASATEASIADSEGRAVPLLVLMWVKVIPRSVLLWHNHIDAVSACAILASSL
jgi:hypothetical protein